MKEYVIYVNKTSKKWKSNIHFFKTQISLQCEDVETLLTGFWFYAEESVLFLYVSSVKSEARSVLTYVQHMVSNKIHFF